MKRILIITPYPHGAVANQRFRYEQYLDYLRSSGFVITEKSFWSIRDMKILYRKGFFLRKLLAFSVHYLERFLLLFSVRKYDFIFVVREATPLGLPVIEWLLYKIFSKKIIFDFDDAIWLTNRSEANRFVNFLKFYNKIKSICRWSYRISAGNAFLASFAGSFNPNVMIVPTTIDLDYHKYPEPKNENTITVIGWTGTHSTLPYLQIVLPALQALEKDNDFIFAVICDTNPKFSLRNFRFIPWNKNSEINDLLQFDIGIMPMPDDEWGRGKCGFKILQYMALQICPVASPVGVNTQIINHGKNGLLALDIDEWKSGLQRLLQNKIYREQLAKAGHVTVAEKYSTEANKAKYLTLFS